MHANACLYAEALSIPRRRSVRWTGAVSGDFNDPANWEGGHVPGNGDYVIVPGSARPVSHGLDQSGVMLASLIVIFQHEE